jgi:hypothetical protein
VVVVGGGVTFHYIGRMAWSTSQVSTIDKYKYTSLYISLTPTRSRSGRIPNAKTGPKISKQLSRQAFGHDICVLVGRRNMQYADLAQSDLFADKVNVNLDMFGASMMNRICHHVDCTHIVAINDSRTSNQDVELLKYLPKPAAFSDSMGDDTVLSLSTGA